MLGKLTLLAVALAAAALLFAVVCPITATPQAVVRTASNLAPLVTVTLAIVFALLPALAVALLPRMANDRSLAVGSCVSRVDLTCARLC